ncbi:DUF7130 family rubredoxin-like protein [Haloarcula onubensis]|uniref:DUF7130 domain-containing protein n=1 Tax=Haloarcula onubensis TaxID=2950539 RepID=A0ABU2FV07_9EURY|nr:hypothetical protein [Halomicroarcula sp. S3CR25-11]MDS0284605.1 hypothetical protein [Halomicroarcula sp. S3CR25-11]
MTGRGETPDREADAEATEEATALSFGQVLYDDAGRPVGSVRGMEAGGVFLTTRDGVESLSVEHARSGHAFGQAELMWRCMNCGEMGDIDGDLPANCPNCGVDREDLMYWTED